MSSKKRTRERSCVYCYSKIENGYCPSCKQFCQNCFNAVSTDDDYGFCGSCNKIFHSIHLEEIGREEPICNSCRPAWANVRHPIDDVIRWSAWIVRLCNPVTWEEPPEFMEQLVKGFLLLTVVSIVFDVIFMMASGIEWGPNLLYYLAFLTLGGVIIVFQSKIIAPHISGEFTPPSQFLQSTPPNWRQSIPFMIITVTHLGFLIQLAFNNGIISRQAVIGVAAVSMMVLAVVVYFGIGELNGRIDHKHSFNSINTGLLTTVSIAYLWFLFDERAWPMLALLRSSAVLLIVGLLVLQLDLMGANGLSLKRPLEENNGINMLIVFILMIIALGTTLSATTVMGFLAICGAAVLYFQLLSELWHLSENFKRDDPKHYAIFLTILILSSIVLVWVLLFVDYRVEVFIETTS